MIQSLLDNPVVLDALIGFLALVAGWGYRRLIQLVDSKWATEHLSGIGLHAGHAVESAARVYREGIDRANDPDSEEGETITTAERKAARDLALERLLDDVGISKLRRALGISRGQKVTDDAARKFAGELVDSVTESSRPFVNGSTGSSVDQ